MSRREDLETIRSVLLDALTDADAAVKAQIAGQLRLVVKELDELPTKGESTVDELRQRRQRRQADVSDGTASG